MPEVAKDAAVLVDPFSIDSIANAMLAVYMDKALRQSLIIKGRIRKLDFSWDKTAAALWKSIENTLYLYNYTVFHDFYFLNIFLCSG